MRLYTFIICLHYSLEVIKPHLGLFLYIIDLIIDK